MERERTDTLTPREISLSHPGLGLHPKAGAEDEHGAVSLKAHLFSALSSLLDSYRGCQGEHAEDRGLRPGYQPACSAPLLAAR